MKVYTLTGKSGTGKSFQAMNLCREYDIESIIDDGIFIYRDRVMAGTSAKREKTKVGAIKAAMLIREEQREEVKRSIESVKPESILVIATSDKMAEEICEQLLRLETDKAYYQQQVQVGLQRSKLFSWKFTAEQLLSLYETVYRENKY
jgi:ABC-type glutathione transport system ATPase component